MISWFGRDKKAISDEVTVKHGWLNVVSVSFKLTLFY